MILNFDYELKLGNFTSWKRFILSQMNPKEFVHNTATQLNYLT